MLNTLYKADGMRRTLVEGENALREEIARLEERHAKIERDPALEEEATLDWREARRPGDAQGLLEGAAHGMGARPQEAQTKREALRQPYNRAQAAAIVSSPLARTVRANVQSCAGREPATLSFEPSTSRSRP